MTLEHHSKPLLCSLGKIDNSVIIANTAVLQFVYFPKAGFERLSTISNTQKQQNCGKVKYMIYNAGNLRRVSAAVIEIHSGHATILKCLLIHPTSPQSFAPTIRHGVI
jgi:hypothetical protein